MMGVNDKMAESLNVSMLSLLVSAGPIVIAQIMANLTDKTRRSVFYPFHKDGWSNLSSHLVISTVACVVPVYIFVHMLLSPPEQSAYFHIWT